LRGAGPVSFRSRNDVRVPNVLFEELRLEFVARLVPVDVIAKEALI